MQGVDVFGGAGEETFVRKCVVVFVRHRSRDVGWALAILM